MNYSNITALIATILRDDYLFECIGSLRERFPGIKIIVGDGGHPSPVKDVFMKANDVSYHALPFGSGITVARNYLWKYVKTPYVLVGDDDFYYDEGVNLDAMRSLLDKADVVGGGLVLDNQFQNYEGFIKFTDDRGLVYTPLEHSNWDSHHGHRYKMCDMTFNFFLAKTNIKTKWDENIHTAYEHSDWFIQLKLDGYKVAYTPDSVVLHKPHWIAKPKQEYAFYRYLGKDAKGYFFRKWQIDYGIDFAGRRSEPDPLPTLEDVTLLVSTFERPDCVKRLIDSIRQFYPDVKIIVADDSEVPTRIDGVEYYAVPFDSGLSYKRNFMLGKAKTQYVVVLDDDFIFTDKTNLEGMLETIVDTDLDILAGGVTVGGKTLHYEGLIERQGSTVTLHNQSRGKIGNRVWLYDLVLNFFIAKRKRLKSIGWDNDLKLAEHLEFFMRAQGLLKVGYCSRFVVQDGKWNDARYKAFRLRGNEFALLAMRKHGLRKIIGFNGVPLTRKLKEQ